MCEQEIARGADGAQEGTCPGGRAGLPGVYFPLDRWPPCEPEPLEEWQPRPPGLRVSGSSGARKVLYSRNNCQPAEIPQDFAWHYYHAMTDIADRWSERSRRGPLGSRRYAIARHRGVRWDPHERMELCGRRTATIACGCRQVRVPIGCGLRLLCPSCARREASRRRRRLTRAMVAVQRAADATWRGGGGPRWALMTLTTAHSGDLARDRAAILAGFTSIRKWLHRTLRRAPPYALVWEVTPGHDGLGHVHCHAAVHLPRLSKSQFKELRGIWLRSVPESRQFHLTGAHKGATGAARYLAKYVSKVLDLSEFSHELAAKVCRANYNQRVVSTSRRFWIAQPGTCKTCHGVWTLTEKPQALVALAPLSVAALDALVPRYSRGQFTWSWGRPPP